MDFEYAGNEVPTNQEKKTLINLDSETSRAIAAWLRDYLENDIKAISDLSQNLTDDPNQTEVNPKIAVTEALTRIIGTIKNLYFAEKRNLKLMDGRAGWTLTFDKIPQNIDQLSLNDIKPPRDGALNVDPETSFALKNALSDTIVNPFHQISFTTDLGISHDHHGQEAQKSPYEEIKKKALEAGTKIFALTKMKQERISLKTAMGKTNLQV